jgi:hypothetical protein
MKKAFIPIFLAAVAFIVLMSAMPAIQESRKPVNMFIAETKATGKLPLLQFVQDDASGERVKSEIEKFNQVSPVKLVVGIFSAKENADSIAQYHVGVPGYLIFDADGKLAVQENGEATADALLQIIGGVHVH